MYTLVDDVGGDRLILPFSLAQRCGELHIIVADPSLFIPTRHCLGTHAPTVGELFILPIDSSSCCGFQTDSTMKNRRDAETVQPWADLHPHSSSLVVPAKVMGLYRLRNISEWRFCVGSGR